jgi:hypothetical protein
MVEEVISFYLYLAGHTPDLFMLLHRHDAYELAEVNPVCGNTLKTPITVLWTSLKKP